MTYGSLKHYLFVRYGNNNVYIFTNKADDSVTVHRYIVRMPGGTFSYDTDESSSEDSDFYPDGSSYIESSDVSSISDGTTRSKHYNGGLYGRVKDCMYYTEMNDSRVSWRLTIILQLITSANRTAMLVSG